MKLLFVEIPSGDREKRVETLQPLASPGPLKHACDMGDGVSWRGRAVRIAAAAGLALTLDGCSAPADSAPIMTAVLRTLTADGRTVCIDRAVRGEPLAIFRTMASAPDPARRPLSWYPPRPLRPDQDLSMKRLFSDEFSGQRTVLRRPRTDGSQPLALAERRRLNAAALRLSYADPYDGAVVANSPTAPKAKARWWLVNRLDRGCDVVYTASRPAIGADVAFVSVLGGHWGTTYAVERKGGRWDVTAKWSDWLY